MLTMDVFHQDPFTAIELTAAVDRVPFKPMGLGLLGIFDDMPIRTKALMVDRRDQQLVVLPTSPRGSPATERTTERRQAFYFDVPRIRHGDTLYADEIQSIRAFDAEAELMELQAEVARRLAGPTGLLSNLEYTWEYHRLAAVQGLLLDADSSTIYNWFTQFGITQADEFVFNLAANLDGTLRPLCNQIVRAMARQAKGAFVQGRTRVQALCGDTFWDLLTSHQDVSRTFMNWSDAQAYRTNAAFDPKVSDPNMLGFQSFHYEGIDWVNYRGSDDGSTIAIPTNKVKFFPVGAPGVFRVAWAPAENFAAANNLGQPVYVQPIFDRDRNEWWRQEVSSYPLHICTRPEVLQSGTADATAD